MEVMKMDEVIKKNSKEALKGNWGSACAFLLIIFGLFASFQMLEGAIATIFGYSTQLNTNFSIFDLPILINNPNFYIPMISSLVFALLQFFVFVPMIFGCYSWFFIIADGQTLETVQIFSFFSSFRLFLKTIWMAVNLFFRSLFWAILLLIPGILSVIISTQISNNYQLSSKPNAMLIGALLNIFGVLLIIVGVIFLALILQKYFLAKYIFIQNNNKKVRECVKFSILMMNGHKKDILLFRISFIGWFLLIPITLFVGSLYVLPYQATSLASYARYIIQSKLYDFHKNMVPDVVQDET
jgi:uncharacterized membrane protein